MADSGKFTHRAIARNRIRTSFDWVEVGKGRFEIDPETGSVDSAHIVLDRLPVGGFDGYVRLLSFDTPLPSISSNPHRPGAQSDGDEN